MNGADPATAIAGVGGLPGKVYYATGESKGRLTGASRFSRVKYTGVYPGIDLEYYGRDRQFEFDFTVAPHADPRQIRLEFAGADRISVGNDGALRLELGSEHLLLKTPRIYQERDGIRHEISGGYRVSRRHRDEVQFTIGRYDPSLPSSSIPRSSTPRTPDARETSRSPARRSCRMATSICSGPLPSCLISKRGRSGSTRHQRIPNIRPCTVS